MTSSRVRREDDERLFDRLLDSMVNNNAGPMRESSAGSPGRASGQARATHAAMQRGDEF